MCKDAVFRCAEGVDYAKLQRTAVHRIAAEKSSLKVRADFGCILVKKRDILYNNTHREEVHVMEKVLDTAQYIASQYNKMTGESIDEMKLQKLLYFSQRECIAVKGEPLFDGTFEGWKYGPVCKEVRAVFDPHDGTINAKVDPVSDDSAYILDNVIFEYGALASWKLSELSHKEKSWINSRKGLGSSENGSVELKLIDIKEDAKKVRPYDHVWDMYYDEFEDYEEQ